MSEARRKVIDKLIASAQSEIGRLQRSMADDEKDVAQIQERLARRRDEKVAWEEMVALLSSRASGAETEEEEK